MTSTRAVNMLPRRGSPGCFPLPTVWLQKGTQTESKQGETNTTLVNRADREKAMAPLACPYVALPSERGLWGHIRPTSKWNPSCTDEPRSCQAVLCFLRDLCVPADSRSPRRLAAPSLQRWTLQFQAASPSTVGCQCTPSSKGNTDSTATSSLPSSVLFSEGICTNASTHLAWTGTRVNYTQRSEKNLQPQKNPPKTPKPKKHPQTQPTKQNQKTRPKDKSLETENLERLRNKETHVKYDRNKILYN